jgi:XTP/dITP diphosphohydrolase
VSLPEVERLVAVMTRLRSECPWDAEQTHRSLVQYLIEETAETVEAIETGDEHLLREELGDLLLQVLFHAEIAAERPDGFDLDDVARGIADKLVARHPYVFAAGEVPSDLNYSWEQRKAAEKGRTSVLDGIPEQLSALARANKIISRVRSRRVGLDLPAEPVTAQQVGVEILALAARAEAAGIDPDQAVRDAVRGLERQVIAAEVDTASPQRTPRPFGRLRGRSNGRGVDVTAAEWSASLVERPDDAVAEDTALVEIGPDPADDTVVLGPDEVLAHQLQRTAPPRQPDQA